MSCLCLCSWCSSAMILLQTGLGMTILAQSFIRTSVPFSGSEMESVLRALAYSWRGELSAGVACVPVSMLSAGLLEILRQCIVSSMSLNLISLGLSKSFRPFWNIPTKGL